MSIDVPSADPRSAPPLALRNVWHERKKSFTAIAGIAFALILVLMQLGFLEAVKVTATNIYDRLSFDVMVLSREYQHFFDAGAFPRQRLRQSLSHPSVVSGAPLWSTMNLWRCPPTQPGTGSDNDSLSSRFRRQESKPPRLRGLCVFGVDLQNIPFLPPVADEIESQKAQLQLNRRVLMDVLSHPEFGWPERHLHQDWELGRQRVDVVGGFRLETGFGADGAVLCSEGNFIRFNPWFAPDQVTFGLLRVQPGSAAKVARDLSNSLPPDVLVLTREQLNQREERHWVRSTATGILFGFGVLVALLVGIAVVYQVLSNDVANHFSEYATLKAMGYRNNYLGRVVAGQAVIYAMAAFFPTVALSAILYQATQSLANIPMRLTLQNVLLVFALALGMCLISALLTMRRVWAADPAELF